MKRNRIRAALGFLPAAAFAIYISLFPGTAFSGDTAARPAAVEFFLSPTCHECQQIKNEFLPKLLAGRAGVAVAYRDIGEMDNYKRLFALSHQGNPPVVKVPAVYAGGRLLTGAEAIRNDLGTLLDAQTPARGDAAGPQDYNPLAQFRRFTPLAVIVAGLIDGINPCAFTVIVFFVSFLALQGFRKSRLFAVGAFFIAGVFITYLLIGVGLFGFFYKLGAFWQLRVAFNWAIGGLSLVFGCAAVVDAAKFLKSRETDGMLLSLPKAVKDKIHCVIGLRYRGTAREQSRTMARLAVTAFVTGFLVSLLEAVCTGQMYLPTIVFVMKSTSLKLAAFGYLALYNLMFIVPLGAILVLAVMGMSSGQFTRFMQRHFLALKLSMAALFFFLGIYLLWRA